MAEATTMVLKVDLQCHRCYKKVKKLLCKFHEVKDQKYDEKANTVTVSVVAYDPECIKSKLYSKGHGCIKSIEIKVPEKKAAAETKPKETETKTKETETKPPTTDTKKTEPKKKNETINIVAIYFCKECSTWHQGPCSREQSKSVSLPCNENCGKRVCCGGCGGSGCRSCSGLGWFSWYCTNCSSTSSTSWSNSGYNWCCKGCGSASCSGHCYGGGYNNWGCKGCGSLSCGGCNGKWSCSGYSWYCKGCGNSSCGGCSNSGNRCGSSSCSGCNGCSCGRCASCSQSRCIIM